MMPFTSITGLFSCILLAAVLGLWIVRPHRYTIAVRICIMIGLLIFCLIPVYDLAIAGYIHAYTGDLSITSVLLLLIFLRLLLTGRSSVKAGTFTTLLSVICGAGIFLYPFALGISFFDSYSLGYNSLLFTGILFFITIGAWYIKNYLLVWCIVLSVLAYMIGWYESDNMWDFLLDTVLWVFAVVWMVCYGIRCLRRIIMRSGEKVTEKPQS